MADQSVAAEPKLGTVEWAAQKLRSHRGEDFFACAFGIVHGLTLIEGLSAKTLAEHIRNVVAAVDKVRAEPMDPTGLSYSREADDPTPVSGARVEMHTGAVTDEGLVDETSKVFACTGHGIHPHPGNDGGSMVCLDCPQCRPAGSSVD